MGVYIPNEDMPEDCYTCFCYETEFNMCSLTGKRLDNIRIRRDDCPLIEIDLVRCGECKWYDKDFKDCNIRDSYGWEYKPTDFCSYGERKGGDNMRDDRTYITEPYMSTSPKGQIGE